MGAGAWTPEFGACILVRLIDGVTAYTAEMVDIMVRRLRWVEEEVRPLRVVMCSEPAAALSSTKMGKSDRSDLLVEWMVVVLILERVEGVVQFCWVPVHTGVVGK